MTIWILLRAAGVGAFVMLFLSVVWGLISTTGVVTRRVSKPAGNHFHAVVGAAGLALLGIHLVLLVLDEYMPFAVADVMVPLRASYRPVAVGLGVVAMYAMVLITMSSWVRSRLSTRLWRGIHVLAVPAFVVALLHGVFAGSDTARPAAFALYGASGLLVLFLVLVRALTYGYRAPRPAPPPRAKAPAAEAASSQETVSVP